MFIHGAGIDEYINFIDYLYYRFPNVVKSSTIRKNMAAIGKLDNNGFRAALSPGMPPFIEVKEFPIEGWNGSDDLGWFRRDGPGRITIAKQMVLRFEYDPQDHANYFHTAKGLKVPILGGVLLHFLCHFGYYRAGLPVSKDNCPGDEFEQATYGTWVKFLR